MNALDIDKEAERVAKLRILPQERNHLYPSVERLRL
jgi:hypothetical protein